MVQVDWGWLSVQMAVEAHGGKIWVESEGEGRGANFQFTLPVKATVNG